MSDTPLQPDDELVSAVADGEATPAEDARVAADPRLASRLREFFTITDAITGPVPLVDADVRDAQIERALAEAFPAEETAPEPVVAAAPAPPAAPPPPAPVTDLAAARARRTNRIGLTVLSAAAAFVVLAVAGALVIRAADDSNGGGDATAASAPPAAESLGSDDAGSGGGGSSEAPDESTTRETFDAQDGFDDDQPDTAAPSQGGDASGLETVDFLGEFATPQELSDEVAARVAADPTPTDQDPSEPCRDTLPTDVTLLGRAELFGEEGLVYLETEQVPDRRVWIVTAGKGDNGCEDIADVPSL